MEFTLTDPVMECNQGAFHLKISKQGHEAMRINEECADTIGIQTMTTCLWATNDDYLARIRRLHTDASIIDMLGMPSNNSRRIFRIIFKGRISLVSAELRIVGNHSGVSITRVMFILFDNHSSTGNGHHEHTAILTEPS